MKPQMYVLVPLMGIGMAGFFNAPAGGGLEEISAAVADELIGGANCQNWVTQPCPSLSDATSSCPFTGGYRVKTTGAQTDRYGSGTEWCGCTQQCNGIAVTKSVPKCGSTGTE